MDINLYRPEYRGFAGIFICKIISERLLFQNVGLKAEGDYLS
jgi:hypothetical protein